MPLITSSREHFHGGEFIIAELGPLSRDSADVAEGLVLDAGTVVEFDDDDQLIAFTGEGACAGILIYPVDTRDGIKAAAYIARRAKVRLEGLAYPEGPRRYDGRGVGGTYDRSSIYRSHRRYRWRRGRRLAIATGWLRVCGSGWSIRCRWRRRIRHYRSLEK